LCLVNYVERGEQILTEFVEAAEPRRTPKLKRTWWWQPPDRRPPRLGGLVPTGKYEEPAGSTGFFPEPLIIPLGMV
jgi:hypothetical protein